MQKIFHSGCLFLAALVWVGNAVANPVATVVAPYGLSARDPVSPFWNGALPNVLPDRGEFTVVNAFPWLTFEDPIGILPEPQSTRLWVYGRQGYIYAFENSPNTAQTTIVLDIHGQTQGWDDCGLLGLAFHPEFGVKGSTNSQFIYVYYQFTCCQLGNSEKRPSDIDPAFGSSNRLSRFTVDASSGRVDLSTELVLIDQRDRNYWHNGGAMLFHPDDGFLYLTLGDEGGTNSFFGNDQLIDKSLFSGAIRIDVNQDPGRSHPIRRQPVDGHTANYFIPNDNPFVDPNGTVLEEFWSIGLREPHRMTFDPVTRSVWEGDVGQQTREEINIIERGGNYQWAFREGNVTGPKPKPEQVIGEEKPPIFDYPHTATATELIANNCIIGGYIYRGAEHAVQIGGEYIFGDNGSGRIWALKFERNSPPESGPLRASDIGGINVRQIAQMPPGFGYSGLSGFGIDQNNELYLCQMGRFGRIYRLAKPAKPSPNDLPPPVLSQTGLFTNLATLQPAKGLIPYNVNTPLWSDGALKTRWMALPNHGPPYSASDTITFAPAKEWTFPQGTVFVKHFDLPVDELNPQAIRAIETRLLVRDTNGAVYGVTYKWRDDQTDADLLLDSAQQDIAVRTASGIRLQRWFYPGARDCLACHTPAAGHVLGVNAQQLNGPLVYPESGISDNQLRAWNHVGIFNQDIGSTDLSKLPRLFHLNDPTATLQDKVRSYLAANCAQCHRPGAVRAPLDFRYSTGLLSQGLIGTPVDNNFGLPNAAVISPGSPENSVLLYRINQVGDGRMPPLARNRVDLTAAETINHWIRSLPPIASVGGLYGEYFADLDFKDRRLSRTDLRIDFNWGVNSPDNEVMPRDFFSARWTGFITPSFSEKYTFQTISDDGVRLWIDGRLIIDDWSDHAPRGDTGTVDLVAQRPYSIHLEFYDASGGAQISLSWKSQSQSEQIVPSSALSSTGRLLPDFYPPYWYTLSSNPYQLRLNAETLANYQIEQTSNLIDWQPAALLPQFRGSTVLDRAPAEAPATFFRVKGEK